MTTPTGRPTYWGAWEPLRQAVRHRDNRRLRTVRQIGQAGRAADRVDVDLRLRAMLDILGRDLVHDRREGARPVENDRSLRTGRSRGQRAVRQRHPACHPEDQREHYGQGKARPETGRRPSSLVAPAERADHPSDDAGDQRNEQPAQQHVAVDRRIEGGDDSVGSRAHGSPSIGRSRGGFACGKGNAASAHDPASTLKRRITVMACHTAAAPNERAQAGGRRGRPVAVSVVVHPGPAPFHGRPCCAVTCTGGHRWTHRERRAADSYPRVHLCRQVTVVPVPCGTDAFNRPRRPCGGRSGQLRAGQAGRGGRRRAACGGACARAGRGLGRPRLRRFVVQAAPTGRL